MESIKDEMIKAKLNYFPVTILTKFRPIYIWDQKESNVNTEQKLQHSYLKYINIIDRKIKKTKKQSQNQSVITQLRC